MLDKHSKQLLREDKSRFIDKAFTAMLGSNWKDEYGDDVNGYDVNAVKKFVNSSAVDKYKIDWQEPADALYNDILDAYEDYLDKGGSLSQRAKATKEDPKKLFENAPLVVAHSGDKIDEGIDLVILDSLENDSFLFVTPLSWEACKWIDSFKCGGQGAKWCLGYEEEDTYWNDYTDEGNLFILAFNKKEFVKPSGEPDRLKYMIQLSQINDTQVWKQSDDPKGTITGGSMKKLFGHSWNELATAVVEAVGCDDNVYTMSPEWSYWGDQYDEIMNVGGEVKYYDKDADTIEVKMSELFGQPVEELTKATEGLEEVKIVFDGDTTQGIGASNGIISVAAPSSGFTMLESILSAIACPRVVVMNLYNGKVQLSKDIGQVKELDFYKCSISNLLLTKDFLDKYKDILVLKDLDYLSVKNILYVDITMKEAAKYQASKMMKDIGSSSKPAIWGSKNYNVIDLEPHALFGVVLESKQKRNVRRLVEDIEKQAYRVAKRKHDDTGAVRRYSGDPYIVHPVGVAKIAKAFGGTDEEVASAYLHDTVEDAGATIDDIEEKFGSEVADIVNDVTTDPFERRWLGKEEAINQELLTISDAALFVKLCDMYYNINDHADQDQKDRIVRNVSTLLNSDRGEELDDRCLDLINAILEAA